MPFPHGTGHKANIEALTSTPRSPVFFCFLRLLHPMQPRAQRLTPRLQERVWLPGSLELEYTTWKLITCLNRGKELSWNSTERYKSSWVQADGPVILLENNLWCPSCPRLLGSQGKGNKQNWLLLWEAQRRCLTNRIHPSSGGLIHPLLKALVFLNVSFEG